MQRKPLPPEDSPGEMELVYRAKEGDPSAFALLSEQYLYILHGRAGRYSKIVGVDTEDFVQEGLLALYRAVKGYNPAMGIRFRTYAITCINNSMISAIKTHLRDYRQTQGIHLDEMGPPKVYGRVVLQEEDCPEDIFFQMEAAHARAQQMEALLSEFERQVLKRYLSGQSYQEIGLALRTSTKAVDNALQRVRRKLRPQI